MKKAQTSIRRKLTFAIMSTSITVLLLTSVTFATYEWFAVRNSLRSHVETIAGILAENSSSMIAFMAPQEASNTLAIVRGDPNIVAAALYSTGGVFATWPAELPEQTFPDAPQIIESDFEGGYLIVARPAIHRDATNGVVYVKAHLRDIATRFQLYAVIIVVVLVGSILVALGMSNLLQGNLSRPLLSLAETARAVSDRRDYSVRARKFSEDEVGALTDAFNHMLTQIQERDAALTRNEERFRQLANAVPAMVWTTDAAGQATFFNEQWYEYTGLKPEQSLGLDWTQVLHPQDREWCVRLWNESIRTGTTYEAETRFRRADGEFRWFLNRATPLRDPQNQVTAWFGTSADIEEKKRAEAKISEMNAELERRVQERTAQLEASNRELEAFSYSVAHDLRAPLRSIDGFSQAFLDEYGERLSEDARSLLQRSRQASQRMSQLIDDLLNLSRVARAEMRRQRVDLSDIAQSITADLMKNEPDRKVAFHIQPGMVVTGDDRLLRLALENLLGNAFKFTRDNPDARIDFGRVVQNGQPAFLVRDNGAGFNMAYAGKLFGPFQRLHAISEYPGTGIGLATVHRIIGRHGGRIWPEAEEGKGATFYFTLPGADVPLSGKLPSRGNT